jgi:hypothetical protein
MLCLILMRASEPLVIDIELLLKIDHYEIGICQIGPFWFLICLVISTKGNSTMALCDPPLPTTQRPHAIRKNFSCERI